MSNIIIRTEAWTTKQGTVIKAVARDEKGKILGATNQTANVGGTQVLGLVGKK